MRNLWTKVSISFIAYLNVNLGLIIVLYLHHQYTNDFLPYLGNLKKIEVLNDYRSPRVGVKLIIKGLASLFTRPASSCLNLDL